MARHDALDEPMAGVPAPRVSSGPILLSPTTSVSRVGWRQLGWLAVAAVGVGFAGYLYLVPYRQLTGTLESRSRELRQERTDGHEVAADRDRLKTTVDKVQADERDKAAAAAKHREILEAMAAQLKPPLQELGVTLSIADGRMLVSLAPDKAIDRNGIDVSGEGNAALKILAGAMKRTGTVARIKAPFGAAPAPKQLRSLFGTVGEVAAVRAARVMSALESAGVAPDHLTIVGENEGAAAKDAPKPAPIRGGNRRRRAAMAAAAAASAASSNDRLDIEVEPG
jgi:hypothetical protein